MKHKVNAIYGAFILFCLLLTFLISSTVENANKTVTDNMKTYESIILIDKIDANVLEMVGGARGYFATSLPEYISNFESKSKTVTTLFKELEGRVKENPQIVIEVATAKSSYEIWLKYNREAIAYRKKVKTQSDYAKYIQRTSIERRPLSEIFHDDLKEVSDGEYLELKMTAERARQAKTITKWVSYLGPILFVITIFGVFRAYEQTTEKLRNLEQSYDELEIAAAKRERVTTARNGRVQSGTNDTTTTTRTTSKSSNEVARNKTGKKPVAKKPKPRKPPTP